MCGFQRGERVDNEVEKENSGSFIETAYIFMYITFQKIFP
jgi:hypothetical protein